MKTQPLWISEINSLPALGAPVVADMSVDVAIIGGGFVGLWSAIWLKALEPSLRVAVLEKGRIGHGASGLNGGFLMTWWPKIGRLAQVAGKDDGLWLADETTRNVDEMQDFLNQEQVDTEFVRAGWIWTATSPKHMQSWKGVVDKTRNLGREHIFQSLSREEVARRTGSSVHLAGISEPVNGKVHPAKLGYNLGVIARRKGVEIYEGADVGNITPGAKVKLSVGRHSIVADRLMIASNIAAEHLPELRRSMVLVTSAVVATVPIPDRLEKIGWTGGETVTDSQTRLNYYRTTRSGRIAYGMGVGALSYGNRLTPEVYSDMSGIRITEQNFRRAYPMLNDVPLEYGWSGPIDRTYDGLPLIGRFPNAPNISYGVGWSGNGVGPSRIGARILAGLALNRKERWTENGFVDRIGRKFPPEPIRYFAGSTVRASVARKDECEIEGRDAPIFHRMLAKLAPAGTEDKD
jgi:glycine/D-amino acid oxidase-like deaminating enzyme